MHIIKVLVIVPLEYDKTFACVHFALNYKLFFMLAVKSILL